MSHVGRYKVQNPRKYMGVGQNPVYKSSLELRLFHWMDINNRVKRWGYEIIQIPYFFQLDQKIHKYFMDIYAEIITKDGSIQRYLAEVKSKSDTKPPVKPTTRNRRSTRNYRKSLYTYIKNMNKWKAAQQFAKQAGMKFIIVDESTLF